MTDLTTHNPVYDVERRLDAAIKARNFEIELFWKRSLFFWGFIGAAFVAFVAAGATRSFVGFVIAGFGFVCSFVWSLANRGSKYWFESWEQKVHEAESPILGDLFSRPKPERSGAWLSARRFSVSRLTIALSDYTTSLWMILFVLQGLRAGGFEGAGPCLIIVGVVTFGIATIAFAICTYRSTRNKDSH